MGHLFLRWGLVMVSILLLITACKKDEAKSVAPQFIFRHYVDGAELHRGIMNYTNLAGNLFQVDELQYFISEITLKTAEGQIIPISADSTIHYVDPDIPSSLIWSPADLIPVTDYASISFVFGITEAKNKTGLFVNPPQRDMFWPDMMGGGYHYMKMNGKWKATGDTIKAFNFHLGIGMNKEKTVFYQNYFKVTLPLDIHTCLVSNKFIITMNIEKWFQAPNAWNWNVIGGQIMNNQEAMQKARENGANAFQISYIGIDVE